MIIELGESLAYSKEIEYEVNSSECWNVTSHAKDHDGYVALVRYIDGKKYAKAHRLSYQFHFKDLNDDELVRHKCNNPSCINPSHLEKGSHNDNMKDRKISGNYYGDKNGRSKLKKDDVLNINSLIKDGYSDYEIIDKLDLIVKKSTIQDIRHGRTWLHITNLREI